jgi:hypothetical protein
MDTNPADLVLLLPDEINTPPEENAEVEPDSKDTVPESDT